MLFFREHVCFCLSYLSVSYLWIGFGKCWLIFRWHYMLLLCNLLRSMVEVLYVYSLHSHPLTFSTIRFSLHSAIEKLHKSYIDLFFQKCFFADGKNRLMEIPSTSLEFFFFNGFRMGISAHLYLIEGGHGWKVFLTTVQFTSV